MPKHLENALNALPAPSLRAAISRLALHTQGTLYGSDDFPIPREDKSAIRSIAPLFLLAARGAEGFLENLALDIHFTSLSTRGVFYGDWSVSLQYENGITSGAFCDNEQIARSEFDLSNLPETDIRAALSSLSNASSHTLYYHEGFSRRLPDKATDDGERLTPAGQAAMMLCSALQNEMSAGETRTIFLHTAEHGLKNPRSWRIDITRHSLGERTSFLQ